MHKAPAMPTRNAGILRRFSNDLTSAGLVKVCIFNQREQFGTPRRFIHNRKWDFAGRSDLELQVFGRRNRRIEARSGRRCLMARALLGPVWIGRGVTSAATKWMGICCGIYILATVEAGRMVRRHRLAGKGRRRERGFCSHDNIHSGSLYCGTNGEL
jgi:hypothetical protein